MPEAFSSTRPEVELLFGRISGPDGAVRFERLEPVEVPEPYCELLVHERDMTSTLQSFHNDSIHLEVLRSEREEETYFREVLLRLDANGKAVEYGAIQIYLSRFPDEAREAILEARLPLGRILHDHRVNYTSRPRFFFRVVPSKRLRDLFGVQGEKRMFGRRNTLYQEQNLPLADIVEILPPAETVGYEGGMQ
jgi:chorismate-pyruvate lyase